MLTAAPEERPAPVSDVHDEEFFIPDNFGRVTPCAWCETEHDGGPEHCPRGDEEPPEWEQTGDGDGLDFKRLGQMRWTEPTEALGNRMAQQRREANGEPITFSSEYDARGNCRYGCGGFASTVVSGIGMHHYSCEYWNREGKDKTPF
jgi:hypothetical protein